MESTKIKTNEKYSKSESDKISQNARNLNLQIKNTYRREIIKKTIDTESSLVNYQLKSSLILIKKQKSRVTFLMWKSGGVHPSGLCSRVFSGTMTFPAPCPTKLSEVLFSHSPRLHTLSWLEDRGAEWEERAKDSRQLPFKRRFLEAANPCCPLYPSGQNYLVVGGHVHR